MNRVALAFLLAVAAAHLVDYLTVRRGLDPPGFRQPWRRFLAGAVLAFVFFLGVFLPAATVDQLPAVDPETLRFDALFQLHFLLLATVAVWYALGYLGLPAPPDPGWAELYRDDERVEASSTPTGDGERVEASSTPTGEGEVAERVEASSTPTGDAAERVEASSTPTGDAAERVEASSTPTGGGGVAEWVEASSTPTGGGEVAERVEASSEPPPEPSPSVAWGRRLGLPVRRPGLELGIGLVTGAGVWLFVLIAAALLAAVLDTSGILDLSQNEVPPLILWMAALPPALRLLISLSAGVVEELFFRGFLQPRAGVLLSTVLFVVGHVGYGEPFMLFGLTLLSLFYAFLAAWRRSIWAAVAAHTLFDAVQLLVVIPYAIELQGAEGGGLPPPPLTILW